MIKRPPMLKFKTGKTTLRYVLRTLIVIGVIVGIGIAGLGVLFWKAGSGPVDLDAAIPYVETFLNSRLDNAEVSIGGLKLIHEPAAGKYQIRFRKTEIRRKTGEWMGSVDDSAISISLKALLKARFGISRIQIFKPRITLVREHNGEMVMGITNSPAESEVDLDAGQQTETDIPEAGDGWAAYMFPFLGADGQGKGMLSHLTQFSVHQASLVFLDKKTGTFWRASKANGALTRKAGILTLNSQIEITLNQKIWLLSFTGAFDDEAGEIRVQADIGEVALSDFGTKSPSLNFLKTVNVPVTGKADLVLEKTGVIKSFQLALTAGEGGTLHLPGREPVAVDQGLFRIHYGRAEDWIEIQDFSYQAGNNQGHMTGWMRLAIDGQGGFKTLDTKLALRDFQLDLPAVTGGMISIPRAHFEGQTDFANGRITIDDFSLTDEDVVISATGVVTLAERSPAIDIEAGIENISVEKLLAYWPQGFIGGVREWVLENVSTGTITKGALRVNIPAGEIADAYQLDKKIPDDHIDFKFSVTGATVKYIEGLPPLENLEGEAILTGGEFKAEVVSASVTVPGAGALKLKNGRMHIETLHVNGQPMTITSHITGASKTALSLLDMEPLGYISDFGVVPETVSGNTEIDLEVKMRLLKSVRLNDIDVKARAVMKELTMPPVFANIPVEGGMVTLDVTKHGFTGKGKVVLLGEETPIKWVERFSAPDDKPASEIFLDVTLNQNQQARLNLGLEDFIKAGPVTGTAHFKGWQNGLWQADIKADLTEAELFEKRFGWRKSPGVAARADFAMTIEPDGSFRIDDLVLQGSNGLDIKGTLAFDANAELSSLSLDPVRYGASDFIINGQQDGQEVLQIFLKGPRLDLRPLLAKHLSISDKSQVRSQIISRRAPTKTRPPSKKRVVIKADITQIFALHGVNMNNLTGTLDLINDRLNRLDVSATYENGRYLNLGLAPAEEPAQENAPPTIIMKSDDAGQTFRGLGLYRNLREGSLYVETSFSQSIAEGAVLDGYVRLKKFYVVNEENLSKIGELTPTGPDSGEMGVWFKRFISPFQLKGGVLTLKDALIRRSDVGIAIQGDLDLLTRDISLAGTFVPAYNINNLIGNIPLLGGLLVGREDEGLFGVTFAITGTLDEPKIKTNPLSALAPGIFRRLFEYNEGTKNNGDDEDNFFPETRRKNQTTPNQ